MHAFPSIVGHLAAQLAILVWLAGFASAAGHARACQAQPCHIEAPDGGSYRLVWPPTMPATGTLKPFVFYHGFNGSAAATARNGALAAAVHAAGYILVVPNGPAIEWRGRIRRGWGGYAGAKARWGVDTLRYMERVMADVERRTGAPANDAVHAGFSSGGSMAWYVACYGRPRARAFLPVAGGLRRPYPDRRASGPARTGVVCPGGPVPVMHVHGFSDTQVPLEGRSIGAWHQGDVFEGLDIARRTNGCASRPDTVEAKGRLWCRGWTRCTSGEPLRMCLHPGGHSMPRGWLAEGLEWVQALPRRRTTR